MEMWTEIRRKVLVEGTSKRSIRRDYRVQRPDPGKDPGQRRAARLPPGRTPSEATAGSFSGSSTRSWSPIGRSGQQRHTAKRIFERLRDEHGYTGCSSQVRAQVAVARRRQREVFVPLSTHRRAQFDFGEATVIIAGEQMKAALSVMTLPFSDVFHVSAYHESARDLPGRSRRRLRLLRRGAHPHQL